VDKKLSMTEIMETEASVFAKTFNRQPVAWQKGKGSTLWDVAGKEYLDLFSGHAVMNLGYGHAKQQAAMQAQLENCAHVGNLYYMESQVTLAKALVEHSFGEKVLFSNSGAEIVELAIKLARKWARTQRPQENQYEIITFKGAFHGRTYGALSATGQEKYHQGIDPMLPGFKYVTLNNFATTAAAITNKTCAIMVEPIQGEGGIHPVDKKFMLELRDLCDRNNLLLIFDEIQCGLGRTGCLHAYEQFDVTPDVLLLGKPLGGGLPLSALVTRADVAAALHIGEHGSTFGGNPIAAAGGNVLLTELTTPGFLEQVRSSGAHLGKQLHQLADAHTALVKEVRGIGMMWGLELKQQGPQVVSKALEQGLVINCTAGNVLRFLPALTVTPTEIDRAMQMMQSILSAMVKEQ
jgi:acetylornithine/N-succinyldiaminopimelate aminotransferase